MLATGNFGDWHSAVSEEELGIEDADEQSRQACTAPAVESSASADHHAAAVKDHVVFLGSCDQTRCGVLNSLQLVCDFPWHRLHY